MCSAEMAYGPGSLCAWHPGGKSELPTCSWAGGGIKEEHWLKNHFGPVLIHADFAMLSYFCEPAKFSSLLFSFLSSFSLPPSLPPPFLLPLFLSSFLFFWLLWGLNSGTCSRQAL
jgi:hypothetical protein